MSAPTEVLPGCCPPACASPSTVTIPGLPGTPGDDGAAGVNGYDSFSSLSASFQVPAVGDQVSISVYNSLWAIPGQVVFIQFAGYYEVITRIDSLSMVVENLGYPGNTGEGTIIPPASMVGPAGLQGADGATASTLDAIAPTTGKGQLLIDDGSNAPSASVTAQPVGTNGLWLKYNSATATGMEASNTTDQPVTVNNLLTADRLALGTATVTYAATTNIDFNAKYFQTVSLTGDITFTTSNKAAGKELVVRIIADGSLRNFTFPGTWVWVGSAAPASIAASKRALLILRAFGAADSDVVAQYVVEP